MRYVICAELPENHALNAEWIMKQQLTKLGFTNIRVSINEPCTVSNDIDNPAPCKAVKNAYGIYVPEDKQ